MSYVVMLILFLCTVANAQLRIQPKNNTTVTAGEIVEVQLLLEDKALMDKITPVNLQSSFIPDALWFMKVGTWELTSSGLTTQARVVLGQKFNPSQATKINIAGSEVEIVFAEWSFTPGKEVEGQFIYQEVPWYERPWWKKHGIAVLLIFLIASGGISYFYLHWRKKKLLEKRTKALVDGLLLKLESARDMTSLSQVWAARDEFSSVFPEKSQEFRSFYDVLNQYQFKPSQQEHEIKEIIQAKAKLLSELKGGNLGV